MMEISKVTNFRFFEEIAFLNFRKKNMFRKFSMFLTGNLKMLKELHTTI